VKRLLNSLRKKWVWLLKMNTPKLEIEVRGRNLAEGVPRSITVTSEEVMQAIADPYKALSVR
jgi:rod shape-determining protein MreB